MPQTAFPVDPELTAIAIAYRNPDTALIADSVLPRSPVGSTLFQYTSFNDAYKAFTLPNMSQGPTAQVNRVTLDGQRTAAETTDTALEIPLSFYDTQATGKGVDARKLATELATSLVLLKQEVNVANLVFNLNTYPAANRVTLAGAAQFSDANSDPLGQIDGGLNTALVRPNVLVFGQASWSAFRRHVKVVQAILGNNAQAGMVTRQQVADLFEVQEVLVGNGWLNTAKPGEAPSMSRVWGKHIAGIYRDRAAANVGGLTFGAHFQFGTRVAGPVTDPHMGLRGGEVIKVGESTRPLITAPYAAYFWQNAVA